jgi:hypothetical protein
MMTRTEITDRLWKAKNLQELMDTLNAVCGEDENADINWNDMPVFSSDREEKLWYPWSWDDNQMLVPDETGSHGPAFVKIVDRLTGEDMD